MSTITTTKISISNSFLEFKFVSNGFVFLSTKNIKNMNSPSSAKEKLPYCITGDETAAILSRDMFLKLTLPVMISFAACREFALKKIQANSIHNPVMRN